MKKNANNFRQEKKTSVKEKQTVTSLSLSKDKSLSLIFSKLAEFEDQRLDEDFFLLLGDEGDFISPAVDIPEELMKITSILQNSSSDEERCKQLHNIFQEKLDLIKELELAISTALVTCRATHKKKDLMILEKLRLRQDTESSEFAYTEKADLCRSLQARNKEYEAADKMVIIEEARMTEELRAKCMESVASITKQIEEEETAVLAKQEENDSLATKISQFNSHLIIRDEHLTTQRRARAIEQQLLDAKAVQCLRGEKDRVADRESYRCHVLQLAEVTRDLERQVELYVDKAYSFEDTLDDTKFVFKQFEDRRITMMEEVRDIGEHLIKQETILQEKQQKVLKMQNSVIAANKKVQEMHDDQAPANKCRFLQSRRTELSRDLARLNPSQPVYDVVADVNCTGADTLYVGRSESVDFLDDRPSEEITDSRSGRSSPHSFDTPWMPNIMNSSSGRSCSTPPSSSSRNWTDSAVKENAAGEDTPVSSPSVHSPKRVFNDCI